MFRFCLALLLIFTPQAFAIKTQSPSSVQDLHYGVALFHYFQKEHYDALTELLIAEAKGGFKGHQGATQLMKGGLSLAMNMERQATETFQRILEQENTEYPPEVENAAWFYLAKLRYLRRDWLGAGEALDKVTAPSNKAMSHELEALRGNLAIHLQRKGQAEQYLAGAPKMSSWLPYVYYNLGAAYSREGDLAKGSRYFDALNSLPLRTEEHLALKDKALTASGYNQIKLQDYGSAIDRLTRVRLDSPLRQKALLGYGWAASEQSDYSLALSPWQMLAEQSPYSPSVQEAWLAIPFAYEKAGASAQALEKFVEAESKISRQMADIGQLKQRLKAEILVATLSDNLALGESSFTDRMAEFIAQQKFQNHIYGLRDLYTIQERVDNWREKISVYRYLLEERKTARQQKLENIQQRDINRSTLQLQAHSKQIDEIFREAENARDAIAFANDETRSLWEITENAKQALDYLEQQGEQDEIAHEALRRYRGMLLWQASEEFSDNLWQAKKGIRDLQAQQSILQERQQRLQQAIADAPEIIPHENRLTELEQRLDEQSQALAALLESSENQLVALVGEELDKQYARLQFYQSQARLSLARLYDLASEQATNPQSSNNSGNMGSQP